MADNFISAVKAHMEMLRALRTSGGGAVRTQGQQVAAAPQSNVVKIVRQNPNLLKSRTGNGR